MALVEREAQLERLDDLLAKAADGRGSVAALLGEAGAGKTSLAEAFVARAAQRARVYRSACEDLSIADPLGPLHDLARDARWTLPASGGDSMGQRLALFSDALQVFDSGEGPALLVIEDLHWADDATIDFVRYLGRRMVASRILLLVTARDDGAEAQGRLRRALAGIPADSVARIEVPLLSEAAVLALAAGAGRDGGAIYRASAGNAFFVTELLRAAEDREAPAGVRDAVLARAERLSPEGRAALEAASVFPRRAEIRLLERVCGPGGAEHLGECVAHGMLGLDDGAYAFRHEIARHAIEATLSPQRRQALNARALEAMRAAGGVPMARLLHHAIEAGDAGAVRELAPAAAAEASRLGAHREVVGYYEVALREIDGFTARERTNLYERYAFESHLVGRLLQAIEAQDVARELYRVEGDRVREGDSHRWLSRFCYLAGDRKAADDHAARALALLETSGPAGPELAMALSNLAQLAMLDGHDREAIEQGRRAIALATPLGRLDIVSHALNNMGSAEGLHRPGQGRLHFDESLSIALRHDLPEHAARAYINLGYLELNDRAYRQAESVLAAGIAYCVERDLDAWRDYMLGTQAEVLLRQGRWAEADAAAAAVMANEAATPLVRFPAVVAAARLRMRRGEPVDEHFAALARFLERGMELQRLAAYASLMAERAWLAGGDRDEALELTGACERRAESRAAVAEPLGWRHLLVSGADPGGITDLPEPYRLQLAGDWQAAADSWERIGAPYERALSLLEGDEAAQRAALEILDSLGAAAVAAHARDLMRRRGIRGIARGPRAATRANPAGLTPREMQVLAQIGSGASNKKIAQALALSPKTVDHHVSAILGKLGVGSRGEAMAAARDLGLV